MPTLSLSKQNIRVLVEMLEKDIHLKHSLLNNLYGKLPTSPTPPPKFLEGLSQQKKILRHLKGLLNHEIKKTTR